MSEKRTIKHAVLQYMPSLIRKESINVGIVFHIVEDRKSYFVSTKNISRVISFNDEVNSTYFNAIIDTFHEQFDFPEYNESLDTRGFYNFDDISSPDFLEKRTCNYANEFRFLDVRTLISNKHDLKEDLKNLKDNFLYYDKPVNERIDEKTVKSLLNRQVRTKFNSLDIKKYPSNGDVPFISKPIFYFKAGNDYYKTLTFDYSNNTNLNKEIKCAFFDINEFLNHKKDANIVFIVNNNYKDNIKIYNDFIKYIREMYKDSHHKFSISSVEEFSVGEKVKIN